MTKKKVSIVILALITLVGLFLFYNKSISTTRVATLNFPDFMVEKFVRSNNNSMVDIEVVSLDEVEKISRYDVVLVRIHGISMDARHSTAIDEAIKKGVAVIATDSEDSKINSLYGRELDYITTLLNNGSVKNYRSMFNYLRRNVDKKSYFNGEYSEPMYIPNDYFFHLGEDEFFETFEQYDTFYRKSGKHKEGAPRIAVLMGNINMQNSNDEHIVALISTLEKEGLNIYPISSFGAKKLDLLRDVKPNLIINNPHGRLVMGGADKGLELLKELNAPVVSPLTISELYDKWLADKQGMAAGGMTSMSIVLPELDGAILPFAISAQFEGEGGRRIFDAIPEHNERFCDIVRNFTELQSKPNSEKKVAIYYYKGPGKGTISAESIEGVASLYNTLKMLKSNGYKVEGLPNTLEAFDAMIQQRGPVLGPYALGSYDKYLKTGNPALLSVDKFESYAADILPEELIADMKGQYGDAPGEYMAVEKDSKEYIAVARIELGNVVILPQPLPALGENTEAIVHGVAGAPTYPYVASYFWTRKEFGADALIHFGTHGSLEFIPGKSVALSNYDWSDVLVGDMPHFYIYTVNNIGEGIVAKRRSYATLVSHLTSAFMESELYDELRELKDNVDKIEHLDDGNLKEQYRKDVTRLAMKHNVQRALGIDTTRLLTDADIHKVHSYLEEVSTAKVRDGLYTLGEPYTKENVLNTARLMSVDPIKYSLANLDVAHERISREKLDDLSYLEHRYGARVNNIIRRLQSGENSERIFKSLVSDEDLKLLNTHEMSEKARAARMAAMMNAATSGTTSTKPAFFDEQGALILADSCRVSDEEIDILINKMKEKSGEGMVSAMLAMHGKSMIRKMVEKHGKTKVGQMLESGAMKHPGSDSAPAHGASNAETKKRPSMMERMASAQSVGLQDDKAKQKNDEIIAAVAELRGAINNLLSTQKNLAESTAIEQQALLEALNGGYIEPSTAGDPIVNPSSVPTGRNFYGINPETTPTKQAWAVGRRLAESLLEAEKEAKGRYPEKVSFTLWSSSFITSEGSTIAQIFHLLGVEPMRDGFGYIRSLRLIPAEELGRPRIDVVVQTSGQLRDIAASRLDLINKAIAMAAAEDSDTLQNFVRKGLNDAERLLLEKGFSPKDAREYSRQRVFGGVNGNYGAGIMGLVESGDKWEDREQIAKQYINNMGAIYGDNGGEMWGDMREGVFEAALLNTEVVVQPRSSNMWGALSLDHVYEFMGGLSTAVEHVTGNDPTAYFNDYRNSNRAKVQGLKEAIGVETNSTVFNPKYIKEMTKGGASSMSSFAEVFNNTYGWNTMKPSAIDQHIWNEYYNVYVKDKHNLDLRKTFSEKNPYALQEMTAIMLESARKGMWKASKEQIETVAKLHTEMVVEAEAACSGFVCDNAKLREFISQNVTADLAKDYQQNVSAAREVQLTDEQKKDNVVLKKEETKSEAQQQKNNKQNDEQSNLVLYIIVGVALLLLIIFIVKRRS